MNHKRFNEKHALSGCRICAAIWLMKYERLEDVLRFRLEEILNGA